MDDCVSVFFFHHSPASGDERVKQTRPSNVADEQFNSGVWPMSNSGVWPMSNCSIWPKSNSGVGPMSNSGVGPRSNCGVWSLEPPQTGTPRTARVLPEQGERRRRTPQLPHLGTPPSSSSGIGILRLRLRHGLDEALRWLRQLRWHRQLRKLRKLHRVRAHRPRKLRRPLIRPGRLRIRLRLERPLITLAIHEFHKNYTLCTVQN